MVSGLFDEHLGQLIVGLVLLVFGYGFTSWSTTLSKSTKNIIETIKGITTDFHNHRLESERRITRLETQIKDLEKICEDNKRRHDRRRNGSP